MSTIKQVYDTLTNETAQVQMNEITRLLAEKYFNGTPLNRLTIMLPDENQDPTFIVREIDGEDDPEIKLLTDEESGMIKEINQRLGSYDIIRL